MNIESLTSSFKEAVEANFIRDNYLIPIFFWIDQNNKSDVIPLAGMKSKDIIAKACKNIVETKNPKFVILINEAYTAQLNSTEFKELKNPSNTIRTHFTSKEIALMLVESPTQQYMLTWDIIRNEGEKPFLEFKNQLINQPTEGLLSNFLYKPQANGYKTNII